MTRSFSRGWAAVFGLALVSGLSAQTQLTGVLTGTVRDAESHTPLPGAAVRITEPVVTGVATDLEGNFRFAALPVGRVTVVVSFIGYAPRTLEGIVIASGRPAHVEVDLVDRGIDLEAAVVEAGRSGEALNDMAVISARPFSVEETDRYAGSRGDPARMASNFAGVQGADDSRNDIVVRGNSPSGVLWRVEGIDLPNPNHFSVPGTGGGPVAILNNKVLGTSDFFTAAFPAEFGNSTAAVFDLRMRNGNQDRPVRSFQFGFLGTEAMLEGPLRRGKRASYLINYRYSTAAIFSVLGIDIGTSAVPRYQDGSFRLFFPQQNGGAVAVWGIAGTSDVDIMISEQTVPERNIYGDNDRDQHFGTGLGIGGVTWTRPLGPKAHLKATLAGSRDAATSAHNRVYRELTPEGTYRLDSLVDYMRYRFTTDRVSGYLAVNTKFSARTSLRYGVSIDGLRGDFRDSIRSEDPNTEVLGGWMRRWDASFTAATVQPFAQVSFRPSEPWTWVVGLHALYHSAASGGVLPEPRLGVRFEPGGKSAFSAGLGLHSQTQAPYLYVGSTGTRPDGSLVQPNTRMDPTRSAHAVVGWTRILAPLWTLRLEAYAQHLFDIPVEARSSSFSLVNAGAGFSRLFADTLVNTGTARNIGLEATLARSFRNGWFFLFTGSLFDAKYTGSDGIVRNTDFNGRYATNILASREWPFATGWVLVTGIKSTWVGGRWYGPVDLEASSAQREVVYADAERNTLQFDPYWRLDLKTNLRWNRPSATHELGIDFVNLTDRKNVLKLTFAPDETGDPAKAVREEYQLGFLPIFFYRLDF
jgi:hypothetical protein